MRESCSVDGQNQVGFDRRKDTGGRQSGPSNGLGRGSARLIESDCKKDRVSDKKGSARVCVRVRMCVPLIERVLFGVAL